MPLPDEETRKKNSLRNRAYREANREKRLAAQEQWRRAQGMKPRVKVPLEVQVERRRATSRAWREANRERLQSYAEANREERDAYARAYREKHREKLNAGCREYHKANREELHAKALAYRQANRDKINARQTEKRRAAGVPPRRVITPEERERRKAARIIANALRWDVLKGGRCEVCGWGKADGVKLHVDHIIPVSKGGTNARENLQALCAPCNLGKSDHYEAI